MTTEERAQYVQYLADARNAYHRLMTGGSAVEFRDHNGESIRYSAVSANKLLGYIMGLERLLGIPGAACGPMRVKF